MNKEEFLNFLERSQARIEAFEKQEQAFIKKLSSELFEFVFSYYPEYVSHRVQATLKLKELAQYCAEKVLDVLGTTDQYKFENLPYESKSGITPPPTREDGERELEELKREIPKEDHEYLEQIHWEDFKEIQRRELFYSGLHSKAKEVLVEFYEKDILELKGDYLRLLNDYTYKVAIFPYADEVYGLFPTIE